MLKISLKKLFGVIAIVVLSFSIGTTVFAQARSYEEQQKNCDRLKEQSKIQSLGVGYTDFLPTKFCTANDVVTYII